MKWMALSGRQIGGLPFVLLLLGACSGGGRSGDAGIDGEGTKHVDSPVDSGIGTGGATDAGTRPSCAGLATTCGPSGNESCCTSLLVPGGTFNQSNSGSEHPATVSDYYLDKYEITIGRFRAFVQAGMGTQTNPPAAGAGAHPLITGSGWDSAWNANLPADTAALKKIVTMCSPPPFSRTWTDTPDDNDNRPQSCLEWYAAFAFCAWDGGRLPTDAEWNYATAGGSEQRKYPWGGNADPDYTEASFDCMGDGVSGCSLADFILVGTRPAGNGRWGHADLAGNVWEWTLDCYGEYQMPCNNCANLFDPSLRTMEGGSAANPSNYLAPDDHSKLSPGDTSVEIGSRCARSAP